MASSYFFFFLRQIKLKISELSWILMLKSLTIDKPKQVFYFVWGFLPFSTPGSCSSNLTNWRCGISGKVPRVVNPEWTLGERKIAESAGEAHYSQGGKQALMKSISQSVSAYLLSVFELSLGLCVDLNQMIHNYWWGSEKRKTKTYGKSRGQIIEPKGLGGVGFRDFHLFNQTLLLEMSRILCTKYITVGFWVVLCLDKVEVVP